MNAKTDYRQMLAHQLEHRDYSGDSTRDGIPVSHAQYSVVMNNDSGLKHVRLQVYVATELFLDLTSPFCDDGGQQPTPEEEEEAHQKQAEFALSTLLSQKKLVMKKVAEYQRKQQEQAQEAEDDK